MNPVLFIICFIVMIAIITKIVNFFVQKNDQRKAQLCVDKNVEWQLMDGIGNITIEVLEKHSDKKKIASIVSARISDCLEIAVHPAKLVKIFENLSLFTTTKNNQSDKAIELSALIQQYVLRNVDSYDVDVWNIQVCEDKKKGYILLNQSFLAKVKKNMTVWSPMSN